jgi:hypothetical protein
VPIDMGEGVRRCNTQPHWPEAATGYQRTLPGFCNAWTPGEPPTSRRRRPKTADQLPMNLPSPHGERGRG